MGLQKVQLQVVPENQFPENINMIMSKSVAHALGIKNHPFWVTFGSAADTAYLSLGPYPSNLIRIHTGLAKKLHLRGQPSIYAKFDEKAMHLQFGPLCGILTNIAPRDKDATLFGSLTKFLDECAIAGATRGTQVAVFRAEQIDLEQRIIRAWVKEKSGWISTSIPYPDVIYNRINSRKIEEQEHVQTKIKKLTEVHHIPIFNERFLDKWQVHELLQNDESIKQMLPYTVRYDLQKVKELLPYYPSLFLKPTNGSLGGGIIRLSKLNRKYLYQYATPSGTISRSTYSFAELGKIVTRRILKKPYLIQQGLSIVTYEKRPVDFRVLVQKNREGKWSVTSSVARIANSHHIVSNLSRGGTMRKVQELLNELTFLPKKPTSFQIQQTAITIATAFEKHANGHFAELGIDLALDTKGRIWLLEINSKPSKTDDSVLNQSTGIRPSATKLFDYVHHLVGIKPIQPVRRRRR